MDFYRRRLAGLEAVATTTATTIAVEARSETHGEEPHPTDTVAPYHSALNGVNQPMNMLFKDMLWWTLGIMALVILCVRLFQIFWMRLRLVTSMSVPGEKQTYWKATQWSWVPWLKVNLLWAPLWKKRHLREIKLSSVVSMGTLPSRFHSVILGIIIITNFIYMFVLNWANENKFAFWAELRGRSGTLALVNMVPLIFMAGRNNPLISMLRISFDTFILIHRWLGRLVILEAVIHTIAWAVVQFADGGWQSVQDKVLHNMFIGSGMIGTIALLFLGILSVSPIRHAFYETFLNFHIILALIIFICTYIHCVSAEIGYLPQTTWMIAIFCIWMSERLWRMFNLAYVNWSSRGYSEAVVEAMPGECTRVTIHLPRFVDVKPGTHAFLRFKDISLWESHPFSIAWVEHTPDSRALPIIEKESTSGSIDKKHATTSVSFVIRAQTGFTRKLYNIACESGSKALHLRAAMEGPYDGHFPIDSYGHAVLFAGSTGITHQLSHLRPIIEGYNNGTVATRRLTLVWIVRDYESLEWVRPWMDSILRLPNRKDILRIQLFITRPKNPREIRSASSTVQMFPGRPNIQMLLRKEAQEQQGAMFVSVCGSGNLADDVRHACRTVQEENDESVITMNSAVFNW